LIQDEECSDVNEQTRLTEETENIEQRKAESKQPVVTINAQNLEKPSRNNSAHRYDHLTLIRRRSSRRPTAAQRELVASISRFQRKLKGATIDVWWLYDDGGLTLLVPHLLTVPKSYLEVNLFLLSSAKCIIILTSDFFFKFIVILS
uniref:SLC12 domain-containing protein n=1 Tax=Ascaris lumbricoides TaxID=6252 RepID=A0A0M3ITD4_ASCLU